MSREVEELGLRSQREREREREGIRGWGHGIEAGGAWGGYPRAAVRGLVCLYYPVCGLVTYDFTSLLLLFNFYF